MATTTNFGWQTPDDTDLVKDGAAAIRTLGSSIDTSLVDLKGGTTGQILAKTSNTDMDFTWVANDVGDITEVTVSSPLTGGGSSGSVNVAIQDGTTAQKGAVQLEDSTSSTSTTKAATPNSVKSAYDLADAAIPESLVDAKGDLLTATADNTPARLAVGNNGETLVADSAATVGLRYSPTPSASNPVINGAMDIFQRGTSFSIAASTAASGSTYTADRWQTKTNANQAVTVSRQTTGDTTNLPFIQYCLRYQRNSGQTGTGDLDIIQNLETVNSIPFAGKSVTLSFYARKGADYSAASSALLARIFTGTGTDQNIFSGYTGTTTISAGTATLTTTWQRFSYTVSIGATATQMAVDFLFVPVGTASTNDYYEVTGVQLDAGSVALPFRRAMSTIQGELAACQRYYWRGGNGAAGIQNSATTSRFSVSFPVQMRVAPSIAAISAPSAVNPTVSESSAGSQTTGFLATATGGLITTLAASKIQFGGFTSFSDGRPTTLLTDSLEFSAEL